MKQRRNVLVRNDAAHHHRHVPGARRAELIDDARHEREVRAGEEADADHVDVLLHGRADDLVGRAVQAGVDDLHACVAEDARHHLRSAIVAVEARLRHQHPNRTRHGLLRRGRIGAAPDEST